MAINNEDVKLYESQRLTDQDDGGGRVTGSEVIDGNVNNLCNEQYVRLTSLSMIANKVMTLTFSDLRQYSVIFDRDSGGPMEAQQVLPFAYPDDSHLYRLTVRLLTVELGSFAFTGKPCVITVF